MAVIFSYLLVGIIGLLNTTFFKGEVIVKQEQNEMPQSTRLVQVSLEPEVYRKRAHTFRHHLAQLRNVLKCKFVFRYETNANDVDERNWKMLPKQDS